MVCSRRRGKIFGWILFRSPLPRSVSFPLPYVLTHKNTHVLFRCSQLLFLLGLAFQFTFRFSFSPLVKDEATSRAWPFNWSTRESTLFFFCGAVVWIVVVWIAAKTCQWPEKRTCAAPEAEKKSNAGKNQRRVLLKRTLCLLPSTSLVWNQLTGESSPKKTKKKQESWNHVGDAAR